MKCVVGAGFTSSRTCTLTNLSLVPVIFHLQVPGDGHLPSLCSRSNSTRSLGSVSTVTAPREFEIVPSSGMLGAQSQVEICVALCSNTVRKYHTELHVDVDDVQQGLLLLPITAR